MRLSWVDAVPNLPTDDSNKDHITDAGHPSCFAVFVDHVPAAAQAVRTARVSCGVACSGHGPRNLAAMMTKRDSWIFVRDSKDPNGPTLRFRWPEMDAFLQGGAMGEFDHLAGSD